MLADVYRSLALYALESLPAQGKTNAAPLIAVAGVRNLSRGSEPWRRNKRRR